MPRRPLIRPARGAGVRGAPRRLAFRVEYDGTGYHGWQRQPGVPTIQETLEDTIAAVVGAEVSVDGASRTDAGVHARDQLAAVTLEHPIRPEGLTKAVNRRLPGQIGIRDAHEVPLDFWPRAANGGKTYCYRLRRGRDRRPLSDRYAWRVFWPIDWLRLCEAASHLVGTHDFASFVSAGGSHYTSVRTIYRFEMGHEPHGVVALRFSGNAFLKHMIRNLVGTLVDVGRGHRSADGIPAILAALDRSAAGPTAPPQGLELERMWPRLEAPEARRPSEPTP